MQNNLLTVKEYDSLIEKGILTKYDRIELLNGTIVEKMLKSPKHCFFTDTITQFFLKILNEKAIVRNQNPIWLDDFSEPEPDIVLAKVEQNGYINSHPTPNEIFLILEVADSSLEYDRNIKGLAYAGARIRQYILLNVQNQTFEDYRDPSADGFQSKQTYCAGQNFNLVAFPEINFQVSDFLPFKKF